MKLRWIKRNKSMMDGPMSWTEREVVLQYKTLLSWGWKDIPKAEGFKTDE